MAAIRRDAASSSTVRPYPHRAHARLALATATAAAAALLHSAPARAADLYWDINGTAAEASDASHGSTTTAPGTWNGTNAFWNSDPAGAAAGTVGPWTSGSIAHFSAGTNATGNTSVSIVGAQTAGGIVFEEGNITLTGPGSLSFGSSPFTIQTTHTGNNVGSILVPISGSGDLTISNTSGGDATINLDGPMTGFTGNIIVGAGTDPGKLTKLQLDGPLGDPTKTITLNSYSELSNNNQVTLGDGSLTPTNYTISNPIVLAGSNAWIASANGPSGQQKIVTYAGAITGSGNLWIGINTGNGRGTVVLGAQSSYTGNTYIVLANNNGLVQLGVDNALPSTTNLVFGSGTTGNPAVAPFDFNGHNQTVASLASTTTGNVRGLYNTSPTPVTLTLNQDSNTSFKGQIGATNLDIAPFNNNAPYLNNTTAYTNISLVKNGTGNLTLSSATNNFDSLTVNAGTVTLSGAGNFANNAIVTGGTLAVTNSNNVNPGLTVGGGSGTLNVSGTSASAPGAYASGTGSAGSTLVGSISVGTFGALAPGNAGSYGVMNVTGNVSFNDGSSFNIDWLNSGSVDWLNASTGSVNFSGNQTLNFSLATNAQPLVAGAYPIIVAGNGFGGTPNFSLGSVPNDPNFRFSIGPDPIAGDNILDLFITPNTTVLRWDADGGGNPIIEGAGTWSNNGTSFVDLSTGNQATFTNGNAVDVVIGGSAIQEGGPISLGDDITVTGKLTFSPVANTPYSIENGGGHSLTLATSGPTSGLQSDTSVAINAPVLLGGSQTWTVNGSGNVVTVAQLGQTSAGASATLTKNGAGLLILTGANPGNSIAGLNVTAGTVLVRNANAIASAAPISLDTNGGFGLDADNLSLANPISVGAGGGTLVVSNANVGTLTGNINASGTVTKNGSGVLVLTGANTIPALTLRGFSGSNASYVAVSSPASLGAGTITLNGGGLRALADLSIPNNFTLSGTGTGTINDTPGAGYFDRIDTQGFNVTLTGVVSGGGDLVKTGSGSLTLAGANATTGGAIYVIQDSTLVAASPTAFGTGNLAFRSNGTIQVTSPTPVSASTLRGDNTPTGTPVTVHKTGTGTLILGAVGNNPGTGGRNTVGSTLVIDAGAVQLNTVGGAGGRPDTDQMNLVVNPGAELLAQFNAERLGGSITLAGGTIARPNGAPSSDTILLQSYGANMIKADGSFDTTNTTVTDHHNSLTVTASSRIENRAQQAPGDSATSNLIGFSGPVTVNSGATLTLENQNAGGIDSRNVIAFRGSPDLAAFPDDAFTIQSAATVATAGPGQVRFGRSNVVPGGKVIVGQGAPGAESLLKLGTPTDAANVWFYDESSNPARLVVAGSGNAGLRVEAPMNANYAPGNVHDGATGLFGTNGAAATGNNFTVLSPVRLAALSSSVGSNTIGGTLTVAATDAADVTGAPLTAGPATASPLTLAFDNAPSSASANLTYTLNGLAAGGNTIVNFAKLQVQKTNAGTGSVKLALANNTRINDLSLLNSTTFDLVDHALAIEASGSAATYLSSGQLFSSAVNNDPNAISTIVRLSGSDDFLLGAGDTTTFLGLTLDAQTLLLKPAYFGDINLDTRIDADDYALMDRSVAKHLPAKWFNGDFDGDNDVDAQDYFLLDRSFGLTHGNALSPDLLAQRQAQFGDAYVQSLVASVPEPTTLTLLSLGTLPLLSRRRRRPTR